MVAEISKLASSSSLTRPLHGKSVKMTPTVAVNKAIAKKRVFDLDKFEKKTVEREYEVPTPFTSVDQVLGMDEKVLLAIVNEGAKRQAWKDARNQIAGVSPKIINQFVNSCRLFMFPELVVRDDKGDQTADSRKAHTQAIYAFIRSNEQMLNSLKEAAKRAAESGDDEDEEEVNE